MVAVDVAADDVADDVGGVAGAAGVDQHEPRGDGLGDVRAQGEAVGRGGVGDELEVVESAECGGELVLAAAEAAGLSLEGRRLVGDVDPVDRLAPQGPQGQG
jgi:hypothetical protein